jgi:hypothetical protein
MEKIPIIWQNSIKDFASLNIGDFYSNVEEFTEGFNQEYALIDMEIHISQPPKEEGFDSQRFVIKVQINLALKNVIREIHHQTQLSDRQKHGLFKNRIVN